MFIFIEPSEKVVSVHVRGVHFFGNMIDEGSNTVFVSVSESAIIWNEAL